MLCGNRIMEKIIIRHGGSISAFNRPAHLHTNAWTFVYMNNTIVHVKTMQVYFNERIKEKARMLRKMKQ